MSDSSAKNAPGHLEWSALDLYRVRDAMTDLEDFTLPELEDFCRALRLCRSDWQYFEQVMPGQFHCGGRWLADQARDVLKRLDHAVRQGSLANAAEVRKGIARHLSKLEQALKPGRTLAKH